jgi:hypothetical protein
MSVKQSQISLSKINRTVRSNGSDDGKERPQRLDFNDLALLISQQQAMLDQIIKAEEIGK